LEACINKDDYELGVCRRNHQPVPGYVAL